jgi:aspartyl-tRNA(Asn)/glutamyl-tRNA(Gln) amidotransferase subunit A
VSTSETRGALLPSPSGDDPADLDASGLSAAFAAGRLSPEDALDSCLARTAQLNPMLNAIVALDADGARETARASTERWRKGAPLSPLDGVPITVKDNLFVAGLPATWGSRIFAEFVPDADELPVERLRRAGLVIVGKTNVPEFTSQGYTDNRLFGPTRNPWDPALTPGGSSGGAVASVASGMAPLALATDGGGSIRRPASHTGLFGLKPSVGRIARGRGFPAIMHDFEVVGPVARSIDDIELAMSILAGPDPRDPASGCWPDWRRPRAPLPSLRILWIAEFEGAPVDAEISDSVAQSCAILGELGHRIELGPPPFPVENLTRIWSVVVPTGLAWLMLPHWSRLDELMPALANAATAGAALRATDYAEALALVSELKRDLATAFESYDVILTPSAAALPWAAEKSHPEIIAGQPVGPRGHAVFTSFVNASGCPGLAVPGPPSRSGVPIGFQLVARRGQDELLVDLARDYVSESVAPRNRPAFHSG